MKFTIEYPKKIQTTDIEAAAGITAQGFGREPDAHNYQDTKDHLMNGEFTQFIKHDDDLVGFAIYQRLLWQKCN